MEFDLFRLDSDHFGMLDQIQQRDLSLNSVTLENISDFWTQPNTDKSIRAG